MYVKKILKLKKPLNENVPKTLVIKPIKIIKNLPKNKIYQTLLNI
jgi:hypothetical protein